MRVGTDREPVIGLRQVEGTKEVGRQCIVLVLTRMDDPLLSQMKTGTQDGRQLREVWPGTHNME
jgi:hypothetical protein